MSTDAGQDTSMAMVALLISAGVSMMQSASDRQGLVFGLALTVVGVALAYIRGAAKPHRSKPPKRPDVLPSETEEGEK